MQVGLAVDDIKQVQEDAELKRLALQVIILLLDLHHSFPYTAGGAGIKC